MSDQKLLDTYIDVVVELQASKAFHTASGFHPNEYRKFKMLLRYKIDLIQELERRELQVPKTEASVLISGDMKEDSEETDTSNSN